MDRRAISMSAALMVALAGCGDASSLDERVGTGATAGSTGTGGNAGNAGAGGRNTATPVVGALVAGGPVAGVTYATDTQTGVTDEDGGFAYVPGEQVTFELGQTVLGTAEGAAVVSPFDLTGIEPPIGTASLRQRFAAAEKFPAFHRAANIATLLQSMDQDTIPGNGIDITDAVRERLMGVFLDLDGDLRDMPKDPTLNRALFAIVDDELFSEPHGVRNPSYALQLVYADLGIDPEVYAPTGRTSSESTTRLEYSEWGQELSSRTKFANGIVDSLRASTYDYNGKRLSHQTSNIVFSSQDTNLYDVLGRRVMERAEGGFGISLPFLAEHEYNEAGLVIRTTRDDYHDESTDSVTTYEYDDQDRLVRTFIDAPLGGPIDRMLTESYDANGHHVRTRIYEDDNRLADEETRMTYDEEGRRTSEAEVALLHFIIETRGGQILETVESVQRVDRWVYDSEGLLIEHTRSADFDEPPEFTMQHTYDDRGRMVELVVVSVDNGSVRRQFDYDDSDLPTEERYDKGDDGEIDRTIWYEYDAAGHEISRTTFESSGASTIETTNEPTGLAAAM